MMPFDTHKVLLSARQATTEDLLDRVTVFRDGMEPEAIEIIEMELRRRGVGPEEIELSNQERAGKVLRDGAGRPVRCSFCPRPAVGRAWGWHRLWGRLPVFPRRWSYCTDHLRKPLTSWLSSPPSPRPPG